VQVNSISLNGRQAAREYRLHRNVIFRDFAMGHGDDLEDCSGAIVPNISPSGCETQKESSPVRHL
jgi:hypothetical protein